jgi:RND superfamily putative drug exporter
MSTLTRWVLRHRALVALFWVAMAAAGVLTAGTTVNRLSTDFSMPGAAATANARIVDLYRSGGDQPPIIAVLTAPTGERIAGAQASTAGRVLAAARVAPAIRVVDYANTGNRAFLTAGGRSTFAIVFVPPAGNGSGASDLAGAVSARLAAAAPAGWSTGVTGLSLLQQQQPQQSGAGPSLLAEAMIGALGALVVLAFVFASFLALLPLVMGAVSVLSTFVLVLGLTTLTPVSFIVEFLIGLIGLGVAIDYSLLVVTRWREERAHGRDSRAAVEAAMAHAGRAVVFSGITVAVALLAMIVLPVPMLRSMGLGGVLVPLVSVAVACTLLPVILDTVGPRLDWPRLRTERRASRPWSAWARLVYRRRWLAAAAGTAILAALAVPALSMQIGQPSSAALTATGGAPAAALRVLTDGGVPSGVLTPIEVLTDGSTAAAGALSRVPGVDAVVAASTPDAHRAGTALITVLPVSETSLSAGQATVQQVRGVTAHDASVIGVGGSGPALVDFDHYVYGNFPLVLGLIAVATLVLLTRAFRSLVLAVKAVVFNLVSLGAAYGVLTLVWQDGHGSQTIWGVPATGAITMWVPIMVFAFLFGLSMDYEVFILSRIREAYDITGSARAAVVEGIGRTGRLVTGAAIILMLTFLSMSTTPDTDVRILATGLGAGILIDAVVVRCLMVPALVALLGRWNWWLPAWMGRVLRVSPERRIAVAGAPEEALELAS